MSLIKMWEEAYVAKKLPEEWNKWDNFRTWAIANRYKAEYGYKGEFNPEGCLKAMPGYTEPEKTIAEKAEKVKVQLSQGEVTLDKARAEFELEPIKDLELKEAPKKKNNSKKGGKNG